MNTRSQVRVSRVAKRSAGPGAGGAPTTPAIPPWTFLTNHAHVLICLARDPAARMRDVAAQVGVTERAIQRIVSELEEEGYLQREREGRRNRYEIRSTLPLRHPVERHCQVSALIRMAAGRA